MRGPSLAPHAGSPLGSRLLWSPGDALSFLGGIAPIRRMFGLPRAGGCLVCTLRLAPPAVGSRGRQQQRGGSARSWCWGGIINSGVKIAEGLGDGAASCVFRGLCVCVCVSGVAPFALGWGTGHGEGTASREQVERAALRVPIPSGHRQPCSGAGSSGPQGSTGRSPKPRCHSRVPRGSLVPHPPRRGAAAPGRGSPCGHRWEAAIRAG